MKKHLLFNQSFGTVGSPNQTDETLTRENRIGLTSYLRRTLMLLLAMLTLACGEMWGADYYLLDHSGSSAAFTGDFVCNPTAPTADSRTISGQSFKGYVKTTGNMTSWAKGAAETKTIDYDVKTTSTTFTIYVGNTSTDLPQLYYVVYDESSSAHSNPDVAQTTIGEAIPKGNPTAQYTTRSFTVTRSKNARVCIYTSKYSTTQIYQIVANETGSALPVFGEAGYSLNLNKGRFALNGSYIGKIDGNLEIRANTGYNMGNTSNVAIANGKVSSQYFKFTTPASPGKLKLTYSGGQMAYNTSASSAGATNITSGTEYALSASTEYYLINTGAATSTLTNLQFIADACTAPNHVDISSSTGEFGFFGGETITLTAQAYSSAGTGSPIAEGSITGYQWKRNGTNISGATSKTLTISNCTVADAGDYSCVVSTGATCSTESSSYGTKVYVLQQYIGGETTYNFTRVGTSKVGTVNVTLAASTQREFKIYAGTMTSESYYMGNNGTIDEDASNWDFEGGKNNVKLNPGLGGTFTFTIDYTANGGAPKVSVTYPRKTIYLTPGVWNADGAKFAIHYFRDGGSTGWTDFLTANDCGMSAEIPQWNGITIIPVRFNPSDATPGWNGDEHVWNQTNDITLNSNNSVVITGWNASDFTYGTYAVPTYTISYAKGTPAASIDGSKADETKTCGVDFTLPSSAVFTRTGYTQTGWTTSDGGAQTHALGGSYTDNAAQTFYPVWTVNNYDLTWDLAGGTTTSTGTGIGSGVSSNTTTSQAFGTALTAPTVTKTGYNFSAWSPTVAGTMPAANTTYTATWTAKTTTITINANTANHGSTAPSPITATYGSALPSFTAAAGVSGYSLTGYYTDATSGTKIINTDGTLVRNTDYATDEGTPKWKYETSTLTLYAQYEEEACEPTEASVIFDNNKSAKYNTQWVDGDVTTSGGASWAKNSLGADNHKNCYMAMKLDDTGDYIKITLPTGVTSGSISVQACTYSGNAGVIQITNSGGTELANAEVGQKDSEAYYKVNSPDGGSWTAPTLKTLTYNSVTSGGDYYIKKKSGANIYVYAFSATGTIPCCNVAPDAPTSPTNGATTSTTQAVSWTDAGNDKWEVYVSTSSSTPGGSQTPTASPTTASYTFEDLTASTQYYWWVRSVCDADHKSSWVAGTSFTTAAAEPEALVHWTMNLNTSTWGAASTETSDGTNITSIATSQTAGDTGNSAAATAKTSVASAEVTDNSSPSNSANFTFTVNSAKKVVPEKVTCQVFNVGSAARNYKAQIIDNNGHVYNSTNTLNVTTEATLTDATFNFAAGGVLVGNVTLKVYAWGGGSYFRMGQHVKFYGEVAAAADYTVTHTMSDVTKSAGATSVKEGNNYTATYAGAGGYALPENISVTIGGSPATAGTDYTWTQGTGVVSIPGNKVTGNIVITVTGVAAVNYSITYHCNGAESGCPSNVAATTNLPNPLPSAPTRDGYDFGGWFTDSECTVAAVAGAALTGNTDLYAKWTVHSASECITITNFATSNTSCSNNIPDNNSKYFYGYKGTVDDAHAVTITSNDGNDRGQNSGVEMRLTYNKKMRIYANNTTNATPAGFENVVSVSFKWKFIASGNSGNTELTSSYTEKVGSTTIANAVSITGKTNDGYATVTIDNLAQLNGYIEFLFGGSSSSYNVYLDDIEICTADMASCTTPTLPTATLSNQTVCPGSDIAAWNATPTNASTITAAGQSIAYSWKKKGNDTELANTATFDLGSSATESQAGTYVVTVTVSKAGYASASASAEVDLTVTPATETPSVTASKAKVYATDEVTLTATCGSTGVTWNWYLCANSDGTGAGSSLGTSATYTIASAPAAGTYYYKAVATGDGTHSCGAAEYVYTLVVSAANSCDKEFWFAKEGDRPTGAAAATHITGCPSGSSSASYTASVDGTNYTLTGSTGQKTGNVTIVVPADNTGTLYVVVQGSSSRTITLSKGGVQVDQQTPTNSVWGVYTVSDLDAGTYTLVSSGNISWAMMALKLCPTVACTDDTPTAAATNTTVCAGGTITITATGYETGATFQWQKQNASTSVWEDIDDATSDTYTVTTAAAEHAGNYHIVATMGCARTSNTVTIAVPSAPVFNSFTTTRRIMETQALSISDVSATDAVSYTWYKSADATWDVGDEEIGDSRSLLKPYDGETAGSTYYVICRAANSCGTTTSSAITVTVQTLVEEDCAIAGNSGEHNTYAKTGSVSSGTYGSITELHTNSNNKYIYYTAESGYYFAKATVNACVGNASDLPTAAYSYSTDGGANWTDQNLTGMTTAYADHVINLPANVNAFRVGRRLGDCGTSSNTIYIHQVCFTYNENCTKTTMEASSASVTHEIGDSFTEPTFTVKSNSVALSPQPTITYTSSDETVATVDDDGSVNFQDKAGTVVITASYAGDATYCSSEGSYTITVSCSDEAPRIIAAEGTNLGGCNDNITLEAKKQDGTTNFSDGTYQWYRDGEAISGATGRTYTVSLTGVYSVERTSVGGCVSPSSNKATVTSESAEPEVERLTPFQYYHVDKVYAETSIMRFRHLFAVKNAGTTLEGKHFKMELSRNGGAASDVTNSNAFVMSADTVLLDMNKLYDKYEEDDELVLTCSAVDCEGNVSSIYKNTITIYVIDETPTLALICSGADGDGTRSTKKLVVGGDFLTGYNKADLCVQTGNTSFDKTQEWVLYTRLKENYIVTPVNGYAEFNKLNYEPFDILFLTDYPKASKSDAAATILDDMADLCDYRPLFTFKTHMVAKSPSKWAAKGFMAQPEVPKQSRLRLNIVCYAHPMFDDLKETSDHIQKDASDHSQIVYTMLAGAGHEGGKGMQGFPIDAAEGFVTIGLVHYDATAADDTPSDGYVTWTSGSSDVMMVAAAERQVNLEARMILFSINCGAQSMLTETGRQVVLKSLEYLLSDATITPVADCSFTFTNGAGNDWTYEQYKAKCPACTGTIGDGKWSTAGNWGPDWILQPGKDTEVKIAAPVTVDMPHAKVRTVRILEGGSIDIPAGSGLEVGSTIRRLDGTELSPTEVVDLSIGSTSSGNGTLIFNNNAGDTKAGVAMYSKGFIDYTDPSKPKGIKNYQYIGVPFTAVNALYNYYGSWLYSWSYKGSGYGWQKVPNGGTVTAWTGYCITQETTTTHWSTGTLAATNTVDIDVPAGENMVVGNSWTAPIYVKEFTDDDFENLVGNVYFFNTGVDKTGEGITTVSATGDARWTGGTYVSIPIHASSYTGDSLISSMQGFFVKNTSGSDGVLHLDYDRHVRPSTNRNILSGEMHAPVRRANMASDEPTVLKIKVSGENYDDRLLLLEREDFTEGFDNGWDGDKWDGNESALYIYTTDNNGTENSVSAIPELEGTIIGFRAGEDDAYTLNFEYLNSDEPLYLYDVENNTYTQIMTGMTYRFFTTDNEKHARFIITRSNGQEVATGVESTSGSLDRSKAKKLLIEDKMFIMVNGMLYDATGKVVK